MPLWNVYCTEGTYSSEDKRAFAEAITDRLNSREQRALANTLSLLDRLIEA